MSAVREPKFNFVIRTQSVFVLAAHTLEYALPHLPLTFCFAALLRSAIQAPRVWVVESVRVRVIVAVVSFAQTFTVNARFATYIRPDFT
jgi:hypothetical protein